MVEQSCFLFFFQVRKLGDDNFAIFTNPDGVDRLTITCEDGFRQVYDPEPAYVVELPSGCKAETNAVSIDSTLDLSTTIEAASLSIPTVDSIVSLTNESSALLKAVFDSAPISFDEIDAAKEEFKANIKTGLEKVGVVTSDGGIGWTTILVGFAILALFFVLRFLIARFCCQDKPSIAAAYNAGVASMV